MLGSAPDGLILLAGDWDQQIHDCNVLKLLIEYKSFRFDKTKVNMYFNVLRNLRQEQIQFATIVLLFGFGVGSLDFCIGTSELVILPKSAP